MQSICSILERRRIPRRFFKGVFTSKQGNKNFYKGKGVRKLGEVNSKGISFISFKSMFLLIDKQDSLLLIQQEFHRLWFQTLQDVRYVI